MGGGGGGVNLSKDMFLITSLYGDHKVCSIIKMFHSIQQKVNNATYDTNYFNNQESCHLSFLFEQVHCAILIHLCSHDHLGIIFNYCLISISELST